MKIADLITPAQISTRLDISTGLIIIIITQIIYYRLSFRGRENKVINCIYSRSNAPIIFDSEQMSIYNCLFEDIEWDVNTNGASGSVMIGKGGSIVHSTLRRTGNSEGIRAFSEGTKSAYNRVYDAGNLQHDGSGINVGTRVQKGTYVTHNWVHDSNRQGVRFDYHGMNFFPDDGSVYGDGQFAFNVMEYAAEPSKRRPTFN